MSETGGHEWYSTGTVTLTQGSTAVTGVGTNWVSAGIRIGDRFTIDRSVWYMVKSVNSETSITLGQAYTGTSGSVLNYYIDQKFDTTLVAELAAQVSKQNAIYQTWMDGRVTEVGIPFDFSSLYKTTWASGREYKALDIVMYNSALYVCVVAHTSTTSITPTNKTYWLSYAPEMPAGIDIFNYDNVGTHNIYRGKNLGSSFTAAQSEAIRSREFTDIYVGDYWSFNNVEYDYIDENDEIVRGATFSGSFRVGGCSPYRNSGVSASVDTYIIAILYLNDTYVMNKTATTEGGYVNCYLRNKIITGNQDGYYRRVEAIIRACFGADHVLAHPEYLINAVTDGKPSGGVWVNSTVELLDERDVFGSLIYDSGGSNGNTQGNRDSTHWGQLPIFSSGEGRGARYFRWLRNIAGSKKVSVIAASGASSITQVNYPCALLVMAYIY